MTNEITDTYEIAEGEWDGQSEPQEVDTSMVATHEAEGKGIEFHVSMRNYTLRDMEGLIIEAAAKQIVGAGRDRQIAKDIEERCVNLVRQKADEKLATVTAEILDQPMTPAFGEKKPVTMREFLGLYGREYLTERVDREGNPYKGGYGSSNSFTRMELIVAKHIDRTFKEEVQAMTSKFINEIRAAYKAQHEATLAEQKKRFDEALAALK